MKRNKRNFYDEVTDRGNIPQRLPVPGMKMVQNDAGGFAFEADKWTRLWRFLILGTEHGTFYVNARDLTMQNFDNLLACIAEDAARVVAMIEDVSVNNRALRQSAAIFALAQVYLHAPLDVYFEEGRRYVSRGRTAARKAMPSILRTASSVFEFASIVKRQRGFGDSIKKGLREIYNRDIGWLSYQMVKYRNRNNFSHMDILRLTHMKPLTDAQNQLFMWAVDRLSDVEFDESLAIVEAYEEAKTAKLPRLVQLIIENRLPREAVPNQHLNEVAVWEALLQDMPITAMIRNLGKISSLGMLKPLSQAQKNITTQLRDGERLRNGRVHPLGLLLNMRQYQMGHGLRGGLRWDVSAPVMDALNDAFYEAFNNIEPSDKRVCIGIDVSGSMSTRVASDGGVGMSAYEAAAALAMVLTRKYPNNVALIFDTGYQIPDWLTQRNRLDTLFANLRRIRGGGTDVSQPTKYLIDNNLKVDSVVCITDSESWAGDRHVFVANDEYRKRINPSMRGINVQTTASSTTLLPPDEVLSMEVVGFGADVPNVIDLFVNEEV